MSGSTRTIELFREYRRLQQAALATKDAASSQELQEFIVAHVIGAGCTDDGDEPQRLTAARPPEATAAQQPGAQ